MHDCIPQAHQDVPFQEQLLNLCPLSCLHASIVECNARLECLLQLGVAAAGCNALQLVMVGFVSDVASPILVDDRHQVQGCVHRTLA